MRKLKFSSLLIIIISLFHFACLKEKERCVYSHQWQKARQATARLISFSQQWVMARFPNLAKGFHKRTATITQLPIQVLWSTQPLSLPVNN